MKNCFERMLRPARVVAIWGIWAVSTSSSAVELWPWCIGNGGGKFLCTDQEERIQLAKNSAQVPYLEFVQRAFVANTIRYVPSPDGITAITEHRGGGGINLSAASNTSVRERIRLAAGEWFRYICVAKGGKAVRYPINDDADLVNIDRFACHPKASSNDEVIAGTPMFGIQTTKTSAWGGLEKDPVIIMEHLGSGEEVKKRWGYPRTYKAGDLTTAGMVIEVKVPLAKVQSSTGGPDAWIKLIELEPKK